MMKKNSGFIRDFISEENREYKLRIGSTIASSLAGVVCGAIVASIVWFIAFNYIVTNVGYTCAK